MRSCNFLKELGDFCQALPRTEVVKYLTLHYLLAMQIRYFLLPYNSTTGRSIGTVHVLLSTMMTLNIMEGDCDLLPYSLTAMDLSGLA